MRYAKSVTAFCLMTAITAQAELVQQFKSPAFNGIGWSSHVLTIDSIEKSRKDQIANDIKAALAKAESDAQNTPLSRFVSLFTSQVYAQLATQLSNNLFKNQCTAADGATIPGCVNPTTGIFTLDGNTITWTKTDKEVTMVVVDKLGSVTRIIVPIASFGF